MFKTIKLMSLNANTYVLVFITIYYYTDIIISENL